MSTSMLSQPDQIEKIKARYQARILSFMNRLRESLELNDFKCSPTEELTYDSFDWRFVVHLDAVSLDQIGRCRNQDLAVELTLCESEQWDGEENGMSFRLDLNGNGGRVVASLAPFNYSERCWVHIYDSAAIEERWRIFEDDFDCDSLVERVREYHDEHPVA